MLTFFVLSVLLPSTTAMLVLARPVPCPRHLPRSRLQMSEKAGALSRVGSLDTSLEQALSSLPTKDQYNAVLESLVARRGSDTEASVFDLVKEMNAKRIRLSDAAITALINYGVETTDAQLTLKALLAARANGALRSFASPQATLSTRPAPASFTGLPEVPTDARVLEVSAAGVFLVVAGGILLAEIADLVDFILPGDFGAPPAQLFLVGLLGGWGYDRYTQKGEIFKTVTRGLSRLFERDIQRECATESASFLVGYLLGLPCLAFSPTVFKPLEMVAGAAEPMSKLVSSGSPRLLDRVLVWLMAPVAVESMLYGNTVLCNPSLPLKLLQAARRRQAALGLDPDDGGWAMEDDEARIKWALAEARSILKRYSGLREEVQERMVSGVSAGECVLQIEARLKNQWSVI